MKKSKFKTILEGIILPFAIYFLITMIVNIIYTSFVNNSNPNMVLIQGISNVFIFLVLFPLYLSFRKKYNIELGKISVGTFLYMIPLAFSICVIGNVAVDYIPRSTENIVTTEVYRLAQEYNLFLSLFVVSVLIPRIEELIFRGFFYDTVKVLSNDIAAIIFTSLTFAIAHVDFRQVLYALFAGAFLGYIKYKYKRLIYTIVLHLLMNLFTLIFVPIILANNDIKNRMYILFISIGILFFSMYRICHKKVFLDKI